MNSATAKFAGKVAIVTGASSGLGARFATVLAKAGATVVLAARRLDRLRELKLAIEAKGGRAYAVSLDVTQVRTIGDAVEEAESTAGPIDILVNNSGVTLTKNSIDVTEDEYDFVMNTNAKGAFFVANEVAKRMIARFGSDPKREGRIVNISSVGGLKAVRGIGVYCASKATLLHLTKSMAIEWGRYGINVNAICPGYIRTELNDAFFDTTAGLKQIQTLPRKRLGAPSDLDGILLLLASSEGRMINGAVIPVDDGYAIA
jgi:NAD(P)-dependent dehydrogenase (short-subunit alcohol dehydrogenase family)